MSMKGLMKSMRSESVIGAKDLTRNFGTLVAVNKLSFSAHLNWDRKLTVFSHASFAASALCPSQLGRWNACCAWG